MPPDPKAIAWDTPHPDHVTWDETPPPDKGPTWGQALLSAPGAALGEIGSGIMGAGRFVASLPDDPLGYKIGRAMKAAPGAIAHDLGGMMQYVRNLSPPSMRGSAPTFEGGAPENHPWLALSQGDTDPMRQAVATKPLGLVGDVAALAGATAPGRAAMGYMADLGTAPVRHLARAAADMTPANRAENALLEAARATPGSDPQAIAAALENNRSPVPGVGYSAAQATQDPGMAQLEKGSRINRNLAPAWADFDAGQNTGLFNALHGVVAPATDDAVAAAQAARDAATRHSRMAALALTDQGSLEAGTSRAGAGTFAEPIRDRVAAELTGDRSVLPAVQTVGNWVDRSIPETGAVAGRAYEVRKRLADALNKRAGIDLGDIDASIKSADVTSRALRGGIDEALDTASGGMWRQYLNDFAEHSGPVNSTQALNNIRSDLADKIAGGAVDGNGNPKLSRAYLKQVIERHSTNKFGPVIEAGPQGQLDNILTAAQQMEAPGANYRMAATGGGGSDTASNLALAGVNHLAHALGSAGRLAAALVPTLGETGGATRLAGLLQNPAQASAALRTAIAREAARRGARSSGITPAALAAALAVQPQQ